MNVELCFTIKKIGAQLTDSLALQVGSLVLSTWGGMGKEAATFYKRLADMIAWKRRNPYPAVMGWL